MNGLLENIKFRPKHFILAFIMPCLIIWIALLIFGTRIEQYFIYGVGLVIIMFINFNLYISNEVLNEKLNYEIRKKNISKEKLFEITGLTKYELTEKDHQFEFHVSQGRKKKYLNMLKKYGE